MKACASIDFMCNVRSRDGPYTLEVDLWFWLGPLLYSCGMALSSEHFCLL